MDGATGYELFRDGVSITTTTTETSYPDTGLTPETEYTYHATATNAAGASEDSADLPVTTTTTADDVTPPVIAVVEDSFSVELGAEYTPFTYSATDDTDGDVTSGVVVGGDTVDTSAVGAYDVTFDVDDATGNSAVTVTRTVTVTDTTPPVIAVAGSSETIELTATNTYTIPGATVTDNDPAYSGAVAITGDTPDTSVIGVYTVLYNAPADAAGNTPDEQSIVITVSDTTAPTFDVDGNTDDYATTVAFGGTYTPGVIANESDISGIASSVVGGQTVNVNAPGDYAVTYTVTDSNGQVATITETVTVGPDTTAPTVTLGSIAEGVIGTAQDLRHHLLRGCNRFGSG